MMELPKSMEREIRLCLENLESRLEKAEHRLVKAEARLRETLQGLAPIKGKPHNGAFPLVSLSSFVNDWPLAAIAIIIVLMLATAPYVIRIESLEMDKAIHVGFEYGSAEFYDPENDGTENLTGIIDFDITAYPAGINISRLAVKWEIRSLDALESTLICHGSLETCMYTGLMPSNEEWNASLYLYYGLYGSTNSNTVSAQLLYLNLSNGTSRLAASETFSLMAVFMDSIAIINSTENKNNSEHSFNLPNISIAKGSSYSLNLSSYCSLTRFAVFGSTQPGNFSVNISSSIAFIEPDKNFTGTSYLTFYANSSEGFLQSNEVAVRVTDNSSTNFSRKPELKTAKKDFKPDDAVAFSLEYQRGQPKHKGLRGSLGSYNKKQLGTWQSGNEIIHAKVFNSLNSLSGIVPVIEEASEGYLNISMPKEMAFAPGLYTLEINFSRNGEDTIIKQNFSWGVLAINTFKSVYLENETAKLGISVLDDLGKLVCNASVILDIIRPDGAVDRLSIENGIIKISPECNYYGYTALPDYYADYSVGPPGAYVMNLTAITQNGIRYITDEFYVVDAVAFDVERVTATRIFPSAPYKVTLKIKANSGYAGIINEYVPSLFNITEQYGMGTVEAGSEKKISWNVNLKKGDETELHYYYTAPPLSPEFYLLGKLTIGAWQEQRYWQIASDAGCTANTMNFPANSMAVSVGLNCLGSQVSCTASINGKDTYNQTLQYDFGAGFVAMTSSTQGLDTDSTNPVSYVSSGGTTTLWTVDCNNIGSFQMRCNGIPLSSCISAVRTINVTDQPPFWGANQSAIPQYYSASPSQFNVTWQDNTEVRNVYLESNYTGARNNYTMARVSGTITNGIYQYDAVIPAGTFYWKSWANDSLGQLNSTYAWNFTVSKANPVINLTLNNTMGNITIRENASVWLNGSINLGDYLNISLYIDRVHASSGSIKVYNYTAFPLPKAYNITLVYQQSQNYSFSNITYFINVNDSSLPNITVYTPLNESYDDDGNVEFIFNVSDNSTISGCELIFSATSVAVNTSIDKGVTQEFSLTGLFETSYTWRVNCTDSNSYEASSGYRLLTIDKTNPQVLLNSPGNSTWDTAGAVQMSYTPNDFNLDTCILFTNFSGDWKANQTNVSAVDDLTGTFNATSAENGNYVWNVYCNDSSGRSDWGGSAPGLDENFTVNIDVGGIPIEYMAPTPMNETNISSANLTVNVSFKEENAASIIFDLNGTRAVKSYSGNYSNHTFTGLQGLYRYNVTINDSAGNTNYTETRIISIDSIAPVLYLESPQGTYYTNGPNAVFKYNVSDATAGVKNCSLVIDGILNWTNRTIAEMQSQNFTKYLQNGTYAWSINCHDFAANANSSEIRSMTIDTTGPYFINETVNKTEVNVLEWVCLNLFVNDTFSGIGSVRIRVLKPLSGLTDFIYLSNDSASCGHGGSNWSAVFSNDEQGKYIWNLTNVTDLAGNFNASGPSREVNWTAASNYFLNAIMIFPASNFELNESDQNVNYSFGMLCNVTCLDSSAGDCTDVTLKAEYLNPAIDPVNWLPATNDTAFLINSIANLSCGSLERNSYCNRTFNITTGLSSGNSNISLRCTAVSSNSPTSYSALFVNATVNEHPSALLAYPLAGSYLRGTVLLNASASSDDQNISLYGFELDNGISFPNPDHLCSTNESNCTFNTITQTKCSQNSIDCFIRLNVTDSDSLKSSLVINVMIDNTNPSVRLDRPTNDSCLGGGAVNILYTPFDYNINSCSLFINQTGVFAVYETNITVKNASQDNITINLVDGDYIWNVLCNDSSGNSAFNSTNFTFRKDTSMHEIPFSSDTAPNNSFFSRNWVFVNATIYESNFANITFYLFNSTQNLVNLTVYTDEVFKINFTNLLPNMEYYYNVTVWDMAGNFNSSETRKVTFDNITPWIGFSSGTAMNNSFFNRNWIYINASVNETNFENITFYLFNSVYNLVNESNFTTQTFSLNITGIQDTNEEYYYNVTVRDKAGFEASTSTRIITLDSTAPAVRLEMPVNKTLTWNSNASFNSTAYDINLKNCSLYANFSSVFVENKTNSSPQSQVKMQFMPGQISDGFYAWNVICFDLALNSAFNATNFTISIDSAPPGDFMLSLQPNNTQSRNRSPFMNWTIPPEEHFLNYTLLFSPDEGFSAPSFYFATTNHSNNSFTVPGISQLNDNTLYYWKVIAYDNLSHSTQSNNTFVYITDSRKPRISLKTPLNNTLQTSSNLISFTFNVTDENSMANCSLIINNEASPEDTLSSPSVNITSSIQKTLTNGNYNWSINCTDKAININSSSHRNLTINVQIPKATLFESYPGNSNTIHLNYTQDGSENSNPASCSPGMNIMITAISTQGIGKNGLLIKGSQPINFSGDFQLGRTKYITWKLYYDIGGAGYTLYAQNGDDSTGGTSITATRGVASSTSVSTPPGDIYLASDDKLKLVADLYFTGGSSGQACEHFFDNSKSFASLYAYVIGFSGANISNPLTNAKVNLSSQFNVSCNISCIDGYCINTEVHLQYKTSAQDWQDIPSSGADNLIMEPGSISNPQAIGIINSTSRVNFTIKGNAISTDNILRCTATSTYSDYNGTRQIYMTVADPIAPAVSLNSPENNTYISLNSATLYYTPNDNYNVSNCSLIINSAFNQSNSSIIEAGLNSFRLFNIQEGRYNWSINCSDNFNNTNSSPMWQFAIDTLNPGISYSGGTENNNSFFARNWVFVNVSASDLNQKNLTFFLYNISYSLVNSTNYTYFTAANSSINFTSIRDIDGLYYYNATATDLAGNKNSTETRVITLDNTPPQVGFGSGTAENNSFFSQNFIFVNASVNEANFANITFYLYNSSLDLVNQTNLTAQILSINFTNIEDSNQRYYYNITIRDRVNFENSTPTRVITLDNTPPQIGFGSGTAENNSFFSQNFIFVNVSVNETNFANITFYLYNSSLGLVNQTNLTAQILSINFTNIEDSNQRYYYNATVWDKAGFTVSTKTRLITLDTTAPSVLLEMPGNSSWSSSWQLSFLYTPFDANLLACSLYHNKTLAFSINETNSTVNNAAQDNFTIAIADGYFVWNVLCNDSAGNFAFNATNFTINIDTTYPGINFSADTAMNNSFFARNWIFANATVSESNYANITFYLYNSSLDLVNQTNYSLQTFRINFTGLHGIDERYYYNITVRDRAGNSNSTETRLITLDSTPPQVGFGSGTAENNSFFSQNFIFANVSVNETNFANITFYLYNSLFTLMNETIYTTQGFSINFTGLADINERYFYNVTVRDWAGNFNSTETRLITLDSENPGIYFISPTPENNTNQSSPNLVINISYSDANNDSAVLDFSQAIQVKRLSENYSNFTVTSLANGVYMYNVTINDSAGNTNATETRLIRIDSLPPDVYLLLPANSSWISNSTNPIALKYNATDEVLNVKNCSLFINGVLDMTNHSITETASNNFSFLLEAGDYNWSIACADSLNNINYTENLTVRADLEFPRISMPSINATLFNITSYACLNITVEDGVSGANSTYAIIKEPDNVLTTLYLNGTGDGTCGDPGSNSVFWQKYHLNKIGAYNWTLVYANDSAGNLNSTIVSIIFNATSPATLTVNLTSPLENFELNESEPEKNYTFMLGCIAYCNPNSGIENCTDVYLYAQYNLSGIAADITKASQYLVNFNDSFYCGNLSESPGDMQICTHNFTIRSSADSGTKAWSVSCRAGSSRIGTYSSGLSANLTVNDHPDALFSYPPAGAWLSGIEGLNASASTDDLGIFEYLFEIDDNEGFATPQVLCAGNSANCTFDTTAQTECIQETLGCHLRLNVTDTGNLKNSTIRVIGIDNAAPRISLNAPLNNSNTSSPLIEFNYTAVDINLGTCILYHNASGYFMINESNSSPDSGIRDAFAVSLADGMYTWNINCNDTEGNSAFNSTNYTLKSDRTPPSITLSAPLNNTWSRENLTATYAAHDYLSDVANCSLIVNNRINVTDYAVSEYIQEQLNAPNLTDGYYNWSINCSDGLNNINSSITMLIKIDSAMPTVALGKPDNMTNISAPSYNLNATASDNGIGVNATVFEYSPYEGSSWQLACIDTDAAYGYNCTWDVGSLTEGSQYSVRSRANDSLGTWSLYSTSYNITIDRSPPVIWLSVPANSTRDTDGTVFFAYNVSDTVSGISNCSIIINGILNQTNKTILKNSTNNFTVSEMNEDSYNWSINCIDSAGNSNISYYFNLTVYGDRDAPIVTLASPANNSIFTRQEVSFTYNVTDELSNMANCSLVINGTINTTSHEITENGPMAFIVPGFNDGSYLWQVNCTDNSSGFFNKGSSSIFNLTVRQTSRLIVAVATNRQDYAAGEYAYINTTVTDEFNNYVDGNATVDVIYSNTTNITVPWWNTSYRFRRIINVSMMNAPLPANYTINHSIDTATLMLESKMQADADDLRVAFWNNATGNWTELDRLLYSINSTQTGILFRLQEDLAVNSSDLRYYAYYGNSSAANPPQNRSKVYLFYDNFGFNTLGSYNQNYSFDSVGSAYEDLDSTLQYNAGSYIDYSGTNEKGKSIRALGFNAKDAVIEADIYLANLAPGSFYGFMQLAARITGDSYYFMSASANINPSEIGRYDEGVQQTIAINNTAIFTTTGQWYPFKMIIYDNASAVNVIAYVNGLKTFNYSDDTAGRKSTAGGFGIGGYQIVARFDNLSVRLFSEFEPITSSMVEEELIQRINATMESTGKMASAWSTEDRQLGNYSVVSQVQNSNYFNGFNGRTFQVSADTMAPEITLVYPEDNYNSTEGLVTFNWSVNDRAYKNLTCNITINNKVNASNIPVADQSYGNYTQANINEGYNYWNVTCWDMYNNTNTSITRNFTVIRGPSMLNATLADDNSGVLLDWESVSYAEKYNLFITDNFNDEFGPLPNVSNILDSNFTDTNASNKSARFYKIATVKGSANKTTARIVGKYVVELKNNSESVFDWALFSIPLNKTNFLLENSSNGGSDIAVRPVGCIKHLYFYNSTTGEFKKTSYNGSAWLPGQDSVNFTSLEPGRGYWAEINGSCNITFVGEVPSGNTSIALDSGWNMIGWYSPNISYLPMTSEDNGWNEPEPPYYPFNVNPSGSVHAVDRYNTETERFEVCIHYDDNWGWWPSYNNQDFTYIEPGKAYYLDVEMAAAWEHKPNTEK